MRRLAIDPSIRNLGWASINVHSTRRRGTIKIPEKLKLPSVLAYIALKLPYQSIDELIVEYPEFFQSQKGATAAVQGTTFGLAAIAGFLQGWFGLSDDRVHLYTPSEWKGQIPKDGMMYRFKKRFGYDALNDHEAEASLLLEYHLNKFVN